MVKNIDNIKTKANKILRKYFLVNPIINRTTDMTPK